MKRVKIEVTSPYYCITKIVGENKAEEVLRELRELHKHTIEKRGYSFAGEMKVTTTLLHF